MKKFFPALFLFVCIHTNAQIGIGTTSPNSTLDVRGSLSMKYTAFSGNTSAGASDNILVFTGTSAATLTLPDATACQGRTYWIKNTSSNGSTLTIATTSSQTIDGLASWSLTQTNKVFVVISNGANWLVSSESLPGASAGTPWIYGGNNVTSQQNFGTTSNYHLPFITNNTERMRLTSTGNLGIGTSTFNFIYPEKLLVDAGATGNTLYQNVIVGKGNTNSYAQLNIQNSSAGTGASSDVVATANNGDETVNYVDMGINGSGNTSSGVIGGANTAYLYSTGNDFAIGNGSNSKNLNFFTTTLSTYTERMRITSAGNVGIANTSPTEKLDVTGNIRFSGALMPNNSAGTTGQFLMSGGAGAAPTWSDGSGYAWLLNGNGVSSIKNLGTTSNYDLPFITNNTEKMRIKTTGSVGIGTTTFNATYPERLLVDAGATGNTNYQNVIVGKGNTNSYAQLNIQNLSAGTSASSDVVATANNGDETNYYVDMGINGSAYSGGIMGSANDAYLYNMGQNMLIGTGTASKSLVFMTGGTSQSTNERMRIDGSGNVGIGLTSPTAKLHVTNTATTTHNIVQFLSPNLATTNATYLKLGKALSNGDQADIFYNWTGANSSSNYLGFSFYNKPIYMLLNNAGNVYVGSNSAFDATNPEKFLVDAGTTSSYNVISGKGTINNYLQLNIQNKSSGGSASSDVVATSDNGTETVNYIDMGINGGGNTSTGVLGGANTAYLYATGNDFAIGNGTSSKNLIFFTTTTGTYTERMRLNSTGLIPGADNTYSLGQSGTRWSAVWAANGTIQTSDYRLKTNIHSLRYGLREVLAMQPVSYNWKDNPGSNHKIGLIAQEVKTIVPEVVIGDETKENLGMNYAELIPVLINAIKEQQKQIDDLNKKIKALERK